MIDTLGYLDEEGGRKQMLTQMKRPFIGALNTSDRVQREYTLIFPCFRSDVECAERRAGLPVRNTFAEQNPRGTSLHCAQRAPIPWCIVLHKARGNSNSPCHYLVLNMHPVMKIPPPLLARPPTQSLRLQWWPRQMYL